MIYCNDFFYCKKNLLLKISIFPSLLEKPSKLLPVLTPPSPPSCPGWLPPSLGFLLFPEHVELVSIAWPLQLLFPLKHISPTRWQGLFFPKSLPSLLSTAIAHHPCNFIIHLFHLFAYCLSLWIEYKLPKYRDFVRLFPAVSLMPKTAPGIEQELNEHMANKE